MIWTVTRLRLLRRWRRFRRFRRRVFLEVLRWREKRSPLKWWRSSQLGKGLQAWYTKALQVGLRYKVGELPRSRLLRPPDARRTNRTWPGPRPSGRREGPGNPGCVALSVPSHQPRYLLRKLPMLAERRGRIFELLWLLGVRGQADVKRKRLRQPLASGYRLACVALAPRGPLGSGSCPH